MKKAVVVVVVGVREGDEEKIFFSRSILHVRVGVLVYISDRFIYYAAYNCKVTSRRNKVEEWGVQYFCG